MYQGHTLLPRMQSVHENSVAIATHVLNCVKSSPGLLRWEEGISSRGAPSTR